MRVLTFLSLALVLLSCSGENEVVVGDKTTMTVDPVVFDAGTVLKGEMITAKFTVTNTGKFPLVIADVAGSCTCTVTDFPEEPIPVGASGEIMAHVDTKKTGGGLINKALTMTSNTEPFVTKLNIKANVRNQ